MVVHSDNSESHHCNCRSSHMQELLHDGRWWVYPYPLTRRLWVWIRHRNGYGPTWKYPWVTHVDPLNCHHCWPPKKHEPLLWATACRVEVGSTNDSGTRRAWCWKQKMKMWDRTTGMTRQGARQDKWQWGTTMMCPEHHATGTALHHDPPAPPAILLAVRQWFCCFILSLHMPPPNEGWQQ